MNEKARRRKRPTYDDEFRASAVCMLQSQGYPEVKGALHIVARHLKVPDRTLSRWFNGEQNPPPDQIVNGKKIDLRQAIQNELSEIITALPTAREDATYRELGTVFGIMFDKMRLLEGMPTEIVGVLPQLMQALKAIDVDPAAAFEQMIARAKAEYERQHVDG